MIAAALSPSAPRLQVAPSFLDTFESNSFVGRTDDLRALRAALARGQRLISIVGAPGIGKTRLAARLVRLVAGTATSTTSFCDLSAARDLDELCASVARAAGAQDSAARPLAERSAAIARALVERGRALLVLDGLEHLLPGAAKMVEAWIAAGGAPILVTSRRALGVRDEHVHELAPLPEASELFVDRARALRRGYDPGPAELHDIERLVRRLDRIPLAVELAAARTRVLSPGELIARLGQRFELLSAGPRDVAARHATLRRSIAWSWDTLDEHERCALARASVFRGRFTVGAAEDVIGPDRPPGSPPVRDLLHALRERSLLRVQRSADGAIRLGFFESIREFAAERLAERSEGAAVGARHARHYLDRAAEIEGAPAAGVVPQLAEERESYQAILDLDLGVSGSRATREHVLGAALVLDMIADGDGLTAAQVERVDAALRGAEALPPALLARARLARTSFLAKNGRLAEADAEGRRVIELAARSGDRALETSVRARLSPVLFHAGPEGEAVDSARRTAALCREHGDAAGELRALLEESRLLLELDRLDEATMSLPELSELAWQRGLPSEESIAELYLGQSLALGGLYDEAIPRFDRALTLARSLGVKRRVITITGHRGATDLARGDPAGAAARIGQAAAEALASGDLRLHAFFLPMAGGAEAARDALEIAEHTFARAEELTRDQPFLRAHAAIYAGLLDLARARRAEAFGDAALARAHVAAARSRAEEARRPGPAGRAIVERSDDARLALRILESALDEVPPSRPPSSEEEIVLQIPTDAAWLQTGAAPRVDLARRTVLRRVLLALSDHHEAAPGETLDVDAIIAAAWPGEALDRAVALNRLHVLVASLRKLGLRNAIVHRGAGYGLHARVRLERVPA